MRGCAILAVGAIHYASMAEIGGPARGIMNAGWTGVELFFVLSGYLITGVLLRSANRPHYYRNFLVRRSLRIFPLYYLFLLCAGAYVWPGGRWKLMWDWGMGYFWLYLGSIRFAALNVYPPVPMFGPLWSLQVEEQFYLTYPFLVKAVPVSTLRRILTACVPVALAFRIAVHFLWPDNHLAPYVLKPCRMDSLALGGLVAVWQRRAAPNRALVRVATWVFVAASIAALLVTEGIHEHALMETVGFTLVDCAFAGLLALTVTSAGGRMIRFLEWKPLTYTGTISYGLYLLHIPAGIGALRLVRAAFGWDPQGFAKVGFMLAGAYAAAAVSWKIFERPILSLKDRFTR